MSCLRMFASTMLLLAVGCGGGSSHPTDAAPDGAAQDGSATDGDGGDGATIGAPIPGGGTGGGALAGALGVWALDERDDTPVAGAFVQVEGTAAGALVAMTNASGYAAFTNAALTGKVTVTVGKTGLRTETLVGLSARSVTVSLVPSGAGGVDTAKAHGIVDFSTLPMLPSGSHWVGYADYQRDDRLGHPRNEIAQGMTGVVPDNVYAPTLPLVTKLEFLVNTPTGSVGLYALVARIDQNGSPLNPDDWTITAQHIAILDDLTFTKSEDKAGLSLPVVAPLDQTLMVTMPPLTATLDGEATFALIDRGPRKFVPLASFSGDPAEGIPAPHLTGPFDESTLWVIARADGYDAGIDAPVRTAFSVIRGVTDFSVPAKPPAYLGFATSVSLTGGALAYTPAAGASLHSFALGPKATETVWNITVLDPSATSAPLPSLPPGAPVETVPKGAIDITARTLAIPSFDPAMASYRQAATSITALSMSHTAATN